MSTTTPVATQAINKLTEPYSVSVKDGEFAIKFPGLTLRFAIRKPSSNLDREFIVIPTIEYKEPSRMSINKKHGSIVEGLLQKLDWVLDDMQLPCNFVMDKRNVAFLRKKLEELPVDLVATEYTQ